MTTRRRFTAEFKARVALDALRGDKTIQEIATKADPAKSPRGTAKSGPKALTNVANLQNEKPVPAGHQNPPAHHTDNSASVSTQAGPEAKIREFVHQGSIKTVMRRLLLIY